VLREYDIRGITTETLFPADAFAVGRVFGTIIKRGGGKRICVGYDGRLSSPEMERELVRGLSASGLAVERVGRGPTPMLYFATVERGADGGVMVTGSHNPPTPNGFKLMLGGDPIYGDALDALWSAEPEPRSGGTVDQVDVSPEYIDALLVELNGLEVASAAWDSGNGATGELVERLVKRLPGPQQTLLTQIDGSFPNHHPDPSVPGNLRHLQQAVVGAGLGLGIAFDGDGDRIGVIDGRGRILWGDQILVLLRGEILDRKPERLEHGDLLW